MEYLLIVLFGALVINESNKDEAAEAGLTPVVQEAPKPILEERPVFKPNHYFFDDKNGYYTSDLSTRQEPVSSSITVHEQEK